MAKPRPTTDVPALPAPVRVGPVGPATRREQTVCPIHGCALDDSGWCPVAQAWWFPKFACPACHGWLWDNGYCESCTPKTRTFTGDYFEARFDADAGREYAHYVRVHRGPTPAPTPAEIAGYFAQLRAITGRIGRPVPSVSEPAPGDEPAWIHEG